ncbi:MAG: 16S rRNA (guanine(527)-N(7))-methyltransferase RsmG [Chloroflexi bacterium]|nr:16S rRNA (guanine(527)-N(7))-methyltransferase RsmG [Chloroflexota bacterium]MCL5274826.1 16S rRNA (guanine(527)-N(7))-methyltransferase RsmG [Chloroflexota bacterium]
MSLSIEQIQKAAAAIGVGLDAAQAAQLAVYRDLLVAWNVRFNLTAITDDESILVRHFADSLSALRALPAPGATHGLTLIDVGTGAGLPGIPLKIVRPDLDVTLLDGTGKKVTFCETVIAELGLQGIRAVKGRAEEAAHQKEHRAVYRVVIARALAPLPTLVEYLLPFARANGVCIAMKGSEAQAEAAQAARAIKLLGGELERVDAVALPGVPDQRALVVIRKVRPSPSLYPRPAGKPRSEPIG